MKIAFQMLLTIVLAAATSLAVLSVAEEGTISPREPSAVSPSAGSDIPSVVASVTPAVVSVVITADVPIIEQYYEEYSPFGGGFGGSFAIPRQRQVGTEEREIGGGTGFIVSSDGFIVTNRHVVDSPELDYSILTNDGERYDVRVVAKDPMLDIAILKVDREGPFPYLQFGDMNTVRLGAPVIAIGNALAEFPNSVSVGVISGLSRNIVAGNGRGMTESLEGVIQTDAAINQGNSGGPLLNTAGEVIGMNVAVAGGSENIGFAIPANLVSQVVTSVAETGEIVRPFLGIRFMQITESLADEADLPVAYGVLIVSGEGRSQPAVMTGSAADKAGLREGDIILEVDGTPLDGTRSLPSLLREYTVGDEIELLLFRDEGEQSLEITLEPAPSD